MKVRRCPRSRPRCRCASFSSSSRACCGARWLNMSRARPRVAGAPGSGPDAWAGLPDLRVELVQPMAFRAVLLPVPVPADESSAPSRTPTGARRKGYRVSVGAASASLPTLPARTWSANSAAGTPPSMFTTAIGAQDCSMASGRPLLPPRPYPVETGIPHHRGRTSPATTVGARLRAREDEVHPRSFRSTIRRAR